jgi:hypothetical protein
VCTQPIVMIGGPGRRSRQVGAGPGRRAPRGRIATTARQKGSHPIVNPVCQVWTAIDGSHRDASLVRDWQRARFADEGLIRGVYSARPADGSPVWNRLDGQPTLFRFPDCAAAFARRRWRQGGRISQEAREESK